MDIDSVDEASAIGLIPARGGSKSIPLKNVVPLCGKPLISYVISAGLKARSLDRIVCSTDHQAIAAVCKHQGVEVLQRPDELGADDTPVTEVIRHVLRTLGAQGPIPGLVAVLQPTSPFILPSHIDECVAALRNDARADSAQTITPVIHNAHAFNQRILVDDRVEFRFKAERELAYNKQRKPKHYVFGNLVVTRSRALLSGKDCFGELSLPIEIPRQYAVDIDTAEDIAYADFLLREGKVIGLAS